MAAIGVLSSPAAEVFNSHTVVLDEQGKIIPWSTPADKAYDQFLRQRWDFIKTRVPTSPGPAPRSSYPQYYFYCAYWDRNGKLEPDTWMNDVGEKIPNWFESARLYYAYTGDSAVMKIMTDFLDYTMEHGTSPATFAWPNFPYTTTNAGDLDFRGFTSSKRLVLHEVQLDHAGDIGLTYYRMYLYTQRQEISHRRHSCRGCARAPCADRQQHPIGLAISRDPGHREDYRGIWRELDRRLYLAR